MAVTNGAAGVREKIKFEYGKPETVVLRFATGKEIQGAYGVEFMFSTLDDRIFFLPHEQASDLERLAQDIGQQPITILKTRGAGKGNPVYWQIKPAAQEARALALRSNGNGHHEPDEPESAMARKLRESIAAAEAKKRAEAAAQAQPAGPIAGAVVKACGRILFECLIETIDICVLGEEYARQRGVEIQFQEDSIERFAVHLSISAQDRSSR